MRFSFLVALAILGAQWAQAADLRLMVLDDKGTMFLPAGKDEKIVIISASNVNGAAFVNIGTQESLCIVSVGNLAEAAAVVAAVSKNTTVECYARVPVETNVLKGAKLIMTKEIMIVNGTP